MAASTASLIARLPPEQRLRFLQMMTPEQQEALRYCWEFWARPEQLPPETNPKHPSGHWRIWLLLPGRGFGKTLAGSQWVRSEIESGRRRSIGLVGPTEDDVRKTMIEGPTGIMKVCPPTFLPVFEPSNRRLVWPNGGVAHMFSAEKPSALRGPNLDGAWCVAKGSLIATRRGTVPIEDVRPRDLVLTRVGYRPVVAATMTMPAAHVLRLEAGAMSLLATGNHRIWVEGRGFVQLSEIKPGDRVLACPDTWNGMAIGGTSAAIPAGALCTKIIGRCFCIARSIARHTEIWRQALKSIISTAIGRTIGPRTLWPSRGASTRPFTPWTLTDYPPWSFISSEIGRAFGRSPASDPCFAPSAARPFALGLSAATLGSVLTDALGVLARAVTPATTSHAESEPKFHASYARALFSATLPAGQNTAAADAKMPRTSRKTESGADPVRWRAAPRPFSAPPTFWHWLLAAAKRASTISRRQAIRSITRFGMASRPICNALDAAPLSPRPPLISGGENIAVQNAAKGTDADQPEWRLIEVTRISVEDQPFPVYDLAVEGAHEFFANGILVHNCDEMGAWGGGSEESDGAERHGSNRRAKHAFDNLQFTLRQKPPGALPVRLVITTTPAPMPLLREIMNDPLTVVTRGTIFDNAENLDPGALEAYLKQYGGTRKGRQELYGEMLDSFDGALWSPDVLDRHRRGEQQGWRLVRGGNSGQLHMVGPNGALVYFRRIVISIDPAGSAGRKSNETGLVACGLGSDEHGYLLEDRSGVYSPERWAATAVDMYERWQADKIVAEGNFGGDMVRATLRAVNPAIPVKIVTASRGKAVRAEPISTFYESGSIHHVEQFKDLEDQLVTWDPLGRGDSPDRLDALVWGFTELMSRKSNLTLGHRGFAPAVIPIYRR